MQFLTTHWDGLLDIATLLVAIIAVLVSAGLFVRRNRMIEELIYVEQERDDLRKKNAQQFVRLNKVDPERFLDKADDLTSKADFPGLEDAALAFANAQSEAFGRAAEILAEQRILDSETQGKSAAEEAIRFVRIGIAANPNSKRLIELEKLAHQRSRDIDGGEPIEALDWENKSDVELNRLTIALTKEGKYQLAEIAARRSVPLAFVRTGRFSGNYASAVGLHGKCLTDVSDYEQAEPLIREALEIYRKALGTDHPDYATHLNNLALLLEATGRHSEAEPLYREAIEIDHKVLGTDHPDYATHLNNLAGLLRETGRHSEAEALYHEALDITGKGLGRDHPDYATRLNNLAGLLWTTGRHSEAERLYREALVVFETALGAEHPYTVGTKKNLETFLTERPN